MRSVLHGGGDGGFTLLEVLVALVVISLFTVSIAQMISSASSARFRSRHLSAAVETAQEVLAAEFLTWQDSEKVSREIRRISETGGWQIDVKRDPIPDIQGCILLTVRVNRRDLDNPVELSRIFRERLEP